MTNLQLLTMAKKRWYGRRENPCRVLATVVVHHWLTSQAWPREEMSHDISEEERLAMEIASSWGAGAKVGAGTPSDTVDGQSSTSVGGSKSDASGAAKTADYSSKYDEGAATADDVEETVVKPAAPNFMSHARRLLFSGNLSNKDISRWENESFVFSQTVTYGLKQSQGGPCGVFAAVQARVVETLLFDPTNAGQNDSWGVNAKESP